MAKAIIACQVNKELKDRLAEIAERNERTLSGEVRLALKAHLGQVAPKMEHEDAGCRPLRD